MHLKQKIKNLYIKIRQQPLRITVLWTVVICGFLLYLFNYLPVKTVEFMYSEKSTCVRHLSVLPSLNSFSGDTAGEYSIKNENILKIGNFEILSLKVCLTAKRPPSIGELKLSTSPFGGLLFRKTFNLVVLEPPTLRLGAVNSKVSILKPITFDLSSVDSIFNYQLKVENKAAPCLTKDYKISCNVELFGLLQDRSYSIELIRTFNGKAVTTLLNKDIKTLKATNVINSSLSSGQTVYDKPKVFFFDFDNNIAGGDIVLHKIESDKRIPVATETEIINKRATVVLKGDLVRDADYEFAIDQLEAKDGSTLSEPYKLSFKVSGGPTVRGINIGNSAVGTNARIVITFDQQISSNQDLSQFVSLNGGNASISRTDNQVIIQLNNLPSCGEFSINVKQGLISKYNILSAKGWSYASRVNCRRLTSVIGYSVQGRPIYAYYYGSGPTTVLFTGGIHGSERSGSYIMRDWVSHLDSYAYKIPIGRQIVVVPDVNPDGLAVSSRYNANNVNLDRNFPAANWQSDIDTASGLIVGGGGSAPLSEPEAVALANISSSLRPRLEVSFHAQGSLMGANQAGDSVSIANLYGSGVGYRSMIGQAEAVMGYSITGEYEDWLGEQSIPAILIELPSVSGRYFEAHKSTLWRMINI